MSSAAAPRSDAEQFNRYCEAAMPASCTTLPQRAISDFTKSFSSSTLRFCNGRKPYFRICSFTSGIDSTAVISELSLSRTGLGVCAGAAIACHDTAW